MNANTLLAEIMKMKHIVRFVKQELMEKEDLLYISDASRDCVEYICG